MMDSASSNCMSDPQNFSSLRGFWRRWAQNASIRSGGEGSQVSGLTDFQMIDGDEQPSIERGEHLSHGSVDYEPSIANAGPSVPQILDAEGVEPAWKAIVGSASTKRFRVDGMKQPWEHSSLSVVFRSSDVSSGSVLDGYNRMMTPTTWTVSVIS